MSTQHVQVNVSDNYRKYYICWHGYDIENLVIFREYDFKEVKNYNYYMEIQVPDTATDQPICLAKVEFK